MSRSMMNCRRCHRPLAEVRQSGRIVVRAGVRVHVDTGRASGPTLGLTCPACTLVRNCALDRAPVSPGTGLWGGEG